MSEKRELAATNLWTDLWDFIFPRKCCGCEKHLADLPGLICEPCLNSIPVRANPFCVICKQDLTPAETPSHACQRELYSVYSLWDYENAVPAIIHKFKYENKKSLGRLISHKLHLNFSCVSDAIEVNSVIPVPLHPARKRERGFNQSEVLAEILSNLLQVKLILRTIARHRNTKDQTTLDANQRLQNVSNAFNVKNREVIRGKSILLVDDVITTGATLSECARVLKESGACRVSACTLAKAV